MSRIAIFVVASAALAGGFYMSQRDSGGSGGGNGEPTADAKPGWVDDPASYYDPPREDLVLAVGSVKLTANRAMAEQSALTRARNELLKLTQPDATQTTVSPDGSVQETTQGMLVGSKRVASWASPDGTLYVLASAPK